MQKQSFSIHPVEEEQEQGQEQEHEQGEGGGERVQRLRRSIEKMLTRLQGPSVEESSGSKETERGSKNSEEREEHQQSRYNVEAGSALLAALEAHALLVVIVPEPAVDARRVRGLAAARVAQRAIGPGGARLAAGEVGRQARVAAAAATLFLTLAGPSEIEAPNPASPVAPEMTLAAQMELAHELELYENLEVIEHLDVLDDLEVIEALEET